MVLRLLDFSGNNDCRGEVLKGLFIRRSKLDPDVCASTGQSEVVLDHRDISFVSCNYASPVGPAFILDPQAKVGQFGQGKAGRIVVRVERVGGLGRG